MTRRPGEVGVPRIECHHSGYEHCMPTSPSDPVQGSDVEPEANPDTDAELERDPRATPLRIEPSPELLS